MSRISVILPAFNPGRYLREAIDSVLAQSLTDWELVLVDDGSTENLEWAEHCDPRIRRVRQDNQGLSAARNRGVLEATSDFVAFLDADDVWLPEKLEQQMAVLEGGEAALVSTAFTVIDAEGAHVSSGFEDYAGSFTELLQGNGICASTVAARRDIILALGGFDTRLHQCEDWDMWLRVAHEHPITKLSEVLACYRVHGSNMSKDYMDLRNQSRVVLHRQQQLAKAHGRADHAALARVGLRRLDRLVAHQAVDAARAAARQGRSPLVHLLRALRLSPGVMLNHAAAKIRRR